MEAGANGVPTTNVANRAKVEPNLAPEHAPILHQLTVVKTVQEVLMLVKRAKFAMTKFLVQVKLCSTSI